MVFTRKDGGLLTGELLVSGRVTWTSFRRFLRLLGLISPSRIESFRLDPPTNGRVVFLSTSMYFAGVFLGLQNDAILEGSGYLGMVRITWMMKIARDFTNILMVCVGSTPPRGMTMANKVYREFPTKNVMSSWWWRASILGGGVDPTPIYVPMRLEYLPTFGINLW